MLYAIVLYIRLSAYMSVRLSVCPSVRPSVSFHGKSKTSRRRMMKLCKIIVEVKSIEFEDMSRT